MPSSPAESALQLIYASKEAGGNPKSTAIHGKVDEASVLMGQAITELTATLEKAGGVAGLTSGEISVYTVCIRVDSLFFVVVCFFVNLKAKVNLIVFSVMTKSEQYLTSECGGTYTSKLAILNGC